MDAYIFLLFLLQCWIESGIFPTTRRLLKSKLRIYAHYKCLFKPQLDDILIRFSWSDIEKSKNTFHSELITTMERKLPYLVPKN